MKKSRVHYSSAGGGDVGSIVSWFKSKVEAVEQGNADLIQEMVQDGEATMKHLISTRGTANSGKAGRIDTGRMLNAVTHSFNPKTAGGNVSGRFGWLQDKQDYFGFQEGGFHNVRAGVDVEGMYALVDAYELVSRELQEKIRRNLHGS